VGGFQGSEENGGVMARRPSLGLIISLRTRNPPTGLPRSPPRTSTHTTMRINAILAAFLLALLALAAGG
jgi:hypothetical protein